MSVAQRLRIGAVHLRLEFQTTKTPQVGSLQKTAGAVQARALQERHTTQALSARATGGGCAVQQNSRGDARYCLWRAVGPSYGDHPATCAFICGRICAIIFIYDRHRMQMCMRLLGYEGRPVLTLKLQRDPSRVVRLTEAASNIWSLHCILSHQPCHAAHVWLLPVG